MLCKDDYSTSKVSNLFLNLSTEILVDFIQSCKLKCTATVLSKSSIIYNSVLSKKLVNGKGGE